VEGEEGSGDRNFEGEIWDIFSYLMLEKRHINVPGEGEAEEKEDDGERREAGTGGGRRVSHSKVSQCGHFNGAVTQVSLRGGIF